MEPADTGRVIRCYSNFFDVLSGGEVVRCVLRGRLRLRSDEVLAGDWVEVSERSDGACVIERVLERRNQLVRPAVANVDMLLVVFTLKEPPLNLIIVDKLLVLAEDAGLESVLCLNKADICTADEIAPVADAYAKTPYGLTVASAKTGQGIEEIRTRLRAGVSVLAGQSGVGKSSLLNVMVPGSRRETGEVSGRLGRGRHTTKGVELLILPGGGLVADTPGFSRLELDGIGRLGLAQRFPEFEPYRTRCRFSDCVHRHEPGCAVKEAVAAGTISASRYRSYTSMLEEVENVESRRYCR